MAGGWTRDGAVHDLIEASIDAAPSRMQARRPVGASRSHWAECDEAIPEGRRGAVPDVTFCVDRQSERDARPVPRGRLNKRR